MSRKYKQKHFWSRPIFLDTNNGNSQDGNYRSNAQNWPDDGNFIVSGDRESNFSYDVVNAGIEFELLELQSQTVFHTRYETSAVQWKQRCNGHQSCNECKCQTLLSDFFEEEIGQENKWEQLGANCQSKIQC